MRSPASIDNLMSRLRAEKESKLKGGLYHQTQVALRCNTNRIDGRIFHQLIMALLTRLTKLTTSV